MTKDEDENRKKQFDLAKRLKENSRRNRAQNLLQNTTNANPVAGTTGNALRNPAPSLTPLTPVSIYRESVSSSQNIPAAANQNLQSTDNQQPSTNAASRDVVPGMATSSEPIENESNCSICLRENNNPALCNECYHCFCFPCIQQWSEQSTQCPVCRQEYNVIYHNIRSETEYDTLAVEPRTRQNELENIFPLGTLLELDRAFEMAVNLPPPFTSIFSNPFQPNLPLNTNPLQNLLLAPPTENVENRITVSVTNYNPPDENGRRVVQRTLFIADPQLLSSIIPSEMNSLFDTPSTPNTSFEQSAHLPIYNPLLFPESSAQQPSMIFNPSYSVPYRSLNTSNSGFPHSSSPTFSTTDSMINNRGSIFEQSRNDSLFDRLFRDLTQQMASSTSSMTTHRTSENNSSLQTATTDSNQEADNQSFDLNEDTPLRSGFIIRRRGARRRTNENSTQNDATRPLRSRAARGTARSLRRRGSRTEASRSRGSRTSQSSLGRTDSRTSSNRSRSNSTDDKGSSKGNNKGGSSGKSGRK